MKRTTFLLSGLLALSMLLAACQPATPAPATTAPATAAPATAAPATAAPATAAPVVPTATQPLAPGQLPRNETLYLAGVQWGPPTTFNPLAGSPTWPSTNMNYLYERLFAYNMVTGALDPILGKSIAWPDTTTAVVTLQDGTAWQDGQPLTTDDVLFSFDIAKTHADLAYSTFWSYVSEVTATGDRTVQFKLNPASVNPGMLMNFLNSVTIIPKHIWEALANGETPLSQIVDMAPVGSGPYKLLEASAEKVALVRNDSYWGAAIYGTPAPKYFVHPIFKSNDDGNLAFQNGEVDVSQQFVPEIWKMWEDKGLPVGTWLAEAPYYLPGMTPSVWFNFNIKGLDNPLVRRAIAYSINYPQIAAVAMSRYSATVQSSLILPEGGEKQFFNAAQVASAGWTYDPAESKRILVEDLGATMGADGIYVLPDGTRLGPWTLECAYGWTDWMTAVNLVSESAKLAGIDINTQFPDWSVLFPRMENGDFQMIIFQAGGVGPNTPWLKYRNLLDDRGVAARGQLAYWNYGRYSNPAVYPLLDAAGQSPDPAVQKPLFDQLDKILLDNVVAIPLMYRPLEFYEYNESVWTGFPNADNPSGGPPQFSQAGVEWIYHLTLK